MISRGQRANKTHLTTYYYTEILTAGPGGPEAPVSPSFPDRPCSERSIWIIKTAPGTENDEAVCVVWKKGKYLWRKCTHSQTRTTQKTLLSWLSRFTLLKRNHSKCFAESLFSLECYKVNVVVVLVVIFGYWNAVLLLYIIRFSLCCMNMCELVFLIKTHIGSLWSRESHHSWLSTGSLRARWAGATVLTSGTLSKAQGKNLKQHRSWEITDINLGVETCVCSSRRYACTH